MTAYIIRIFIYEHYSYTDGQSACTVQEIGDDMCGLRDCATQLLRSRSSCCDVLQSLVINLQLNSDPRLWRTFKKKRTEEEEETRAAGVERETDSGKTIKRREPSDRRIIPRSQPQTTATPGSGVKLPEKTTRPHT